MIEDSVSGDAGRLAWIFNPDETDRLRKQFFSNQKLVHYTTAENAINILRGEVWLRNARVMNDKAEIHHGFSLIQKSISSPTDTSIEPALTAVAVAVDQAHPGLSQEVFSDFKQRELMLLHRTYVTCLSVHHSDEVHGRLSMWRAYTGTYAGVALVVNPEPFTNLVENPSFFSTPVSYDTEDELRAKLAKVAEGIRRDVDFIKGQPRQLIGWYLGAALRKIATASKHHGFREEEEWRVMHTDDVDPLDGLRQEVAVIRGIPQLVTKLSLKTDGPFASQGITIPNLLERVIIGPTNYPFIVADAIVKAMEEAGVQNIKEKITISEIPLRME
ncbi:DUF2971 domain-containing protein [Neorhizobium sp. Rsf11]|uniref:DUF2971 domain-containing protein n=1 Tax=Neorhizobium phenanthreniclasticum TaxID=3157917 RepID=A0ABV0M777_9HYPH